MTQSDIDASYRAWYWRTWPDHVLAAPEPVYARDPLTDLITREAIRLFYNSNWFLRTVGRE